MAFAWPLRVYWEDTDAGGIVFYANYLKFFERARTEWLRALGVNQQRLRESTGGIFVAVAASLRYLGPARLDDQLRVTAELQQAGSASMEIRQAAWLATPGTAAALLCDGTIRIGWVDAATFKPARIPAFIREKFQA